MNPRILLVDDEESVTESLRLAFHQWPFEVHTANSAVAALRMLGEQAFDAVVSDERMPGLQGSHMMVAIKRRFPRTARLILTGQASVEAACVAINQGEVHRYLIKPTQSEVLAQAIREAILMARANTPERPPVPSASSSPPSDSEQGTRFLGSEG